MMSGPQVHTLTSLASPMVATSLMTLPAELPRQRPRLRLKPKAPTTTGFVDGGWWPRTRNLTAELPALAEVLSVRLGRVTRVAFAIPAWDPAPRRITVDGAVVRLEGFRSQDKHVLYLTGTDGQRISLLVIPPEAGESAGHQAMMTAASRTGGDRPGEILAVTGAAPDVSIPLPRKASDAALERWGTDGGRDDERG
jgi:hypothetical protein